MGNNQSDTNTDVYKYHESVLKEGAKPVVIGSSDEESDEEEQGFFRRAGPSHTNLDESSDRAVQYDDPEIQREGSSQSNLDESSDTAVQYDPENQREGSSQSNLDKSSHLDDNVEVSEHDDSPGEGEPSGSDAEMSDIENSLNNTAESPGEGEPSGSDAEMSDIENSLNDTAESLEGVDQHIPEVSNSMEENESRNVDLVSSSSGANEGEDEFVTPSSSRENSPHPKGAKSSAARKHRLSMRDSDDSGDEKESEKQDSKRSTRSQSRLKEPKDQTPGTNKSTENHHYLRLKESSSVSVGHGSPVRENLSNVPVDMRKTESHSITAESAGRTSARAPEAAIKGLRTRSQTPREPTIDSSKKPTEGKPAHHPSKVSQREETQEMSLSAKSNPTNIVQMLKKNSIHLKSIIDSKKNGNRQVDKEECKQTLNSSKDQGPKSNKLHDSEEELMEVVSNMKKSSEIVNGKSPVNQPLVKDKGSNSTSVIASVSSGINKGSNSASFVVSELSAFRPIEAQPMNTDQSATPSTSSASKAHKRPYEKILENLEGESRSKTSPKNTLPKSSSVSISKPKSSERAIKIQKEISSSGASIVLSNSKTPILKTEQLTSLYKMPPPIRTQTSLEASQSLPGSPNKRYTTTALSTSLAASNKTQISSSASKSYMAASPVSNTIKPLPTASAGSSSSPNVTKMFAASFPASSSSANQNLSQAVPAASLQPSAPLLTHVPGSPQRGSVALSPKPTQTLTSSGPNHMIFSLMDGYHMSVNLGDITNEMTEAIVNSTDGHLNHAGALSRKIATASGPDMIRECQQIIFNRKKPLEIGDVVHTPGGQLRNVKYLLHVVPPMGSHSDNDAASIKRLTYSYLQCCRYADLKLSCSSIAFPLLGSGSFSSDTSINCFYNAVLIFLSDRTPLSHLTDIRLIVNDYELHRFTVDYLGCCYENILTQGIDTSMADAVNGFYGNNTWETQRSLVGAFFASCRSPSNGSRASPSSSTRTNGDPSGTDNSTQNLFRGPAVKRPKL